MTSSATPDSKPRHFTFLLGSAREPGHAGNTETLARAAVLPAGATQQWLHAAQLAVPPFVDLRHTTGTYAAPTGDLAAVLDATLAATDLVLVAPVYWYGLPAALKASIDHWSAWMRVPGLDFKARMAEKTLWLVATGGDRAKAQPMVDSVQLCAQFLGMRFGGTLWGQGGAPGAVQHDAAGLAAARGFFVSAPA